MKRLIPCTLALSISTCVPITLFSVKVKELPNELSTCVCAAAWMIVSISSVSKTYLSRSAERIFPLMNLKFLHSFTSFRLDSDEQ